MLPFLFLYCWFLSVSLVSGDRRSRLVLPPEPQWTGRPAGAAGGGAWEAEGGVWAAETFAGQAGGGAEEAEAAGQRSGGLHWHAAGAHHGAEAHSPASAHQVKVTAGRRGFAVQSASIHSNLHNSSLVFSLLCCPFWYKYLGTERCRGDVFFFSRRHAETRPLVRKKGGSVPGGSECSGSSGCFQVHTASWFYVGGEASPAGGAGGSSNTQMLPFWNPDCRKHRFLLFTSLVTSITLSQKRENGSVSVHNTVYLHSSHSLKQINTPARVSAFTAGRRRANNVRGHSGGFACFSPLTSKCVYFIIFFFFFFCHFCSGPSGSDWFHTFRAAWRSNQS